MGKKFFLQFYLEKFCLSKPVVTSLFSSTKTQGKPEVIRDSAVPPPIVPAPITPVVLTGTGLAVL